MFFPKLPKQVGKWVQSLRIKMETVKVKFGLISMLFGHFSQVFEGQGVHFWGLKSKNLRLEKIAKKTVEKTVRFQFHTVLTLLSWESC